MNPSWTERFGESLVQRRWVYLIFVLLFSAVSVFTVVKRLNHGLPVDFTPQAIVYDDGPEIRRLHEIEATFGREDNDLLFILDGAGIDTVAGRDYLQAVHRSLEKQERVISVVSLINARVLVNEGFMPELKSIWSEPQSAIQLARQDKLLAGRLISKDGLTTVVRVRLDPKLNKVADLGPVVQGLGNEVRALERPDNLDLHITGVPYVRQ